MANECYNSLSIGGLTIEERETIKNNIADDLSVMEMVDEPRNEEDEVYLSFTTCWEPNNEELCSLSSKYPNGTFTLTFEEENEDVFGASVSKNGQQKEIFDSIRDEAERWMKLNHPEALAELDRDEYPDILSAFYDSDIEEFHDDFLDHQQELQGKWLGELEEQLDSSLVAA